MRALTKGAAGVAHEGLTVRRRVIGEMARMATLEVEGVACVARGGGRWRAWLAGPAVETAMRDGKVALRIVLIAQSGLPLGPLVGRVRKAVAAAVERLLGLPLADVTVVVDGVTD